MRARTAMGRLITKLIRTTEGGSWLMKTVA